MKIRLATLFRKIPMIDIIPILWDIVERQPIKTSGESRCHSVRISSAGRLQDRLLSRQYDRAFGIFLSLNRNISTPFSTKDKT